MADLRVTRGDDLTFRVRFRKAGVAVPLGGYVFTAQVRQSPSGPVLGAFALGVDAVAGIVTLGLPAAVTAGLPRTAVWSLQGVVDGSTRTYASGRLFAEADTTR